MAFIKASAADRTAPKFQLPEKMRVPFGIGSRYSQRVGDCNPSKNLEISLNDESAVAFFDTIDAQNIRVAVENSVAWFKEELSEETIAFMYRTTCSRGSGMYAPLLRVKVGVARSPTNISVVTSQSNGTFAYRPGTIDDVKPHCRVSATVSIGGLWFVNNQWGMSLKCTDLLVYPRETRRVVRGVFPFAITPS